MDPSVPAVGGDLNRLDLEALRRAVEIYLREAYPGVEIPARVRQRLEWAPGLSPTELLNALPFERALKNRTSEAAVYSLRLGNIHYPHMKLQIQPWPTTAGFMISVNTHDQVLGLDASSADLPAFRDLQIENQRVKEAIEQAWDELGLPTFLRYLRDYIETRREEKPGEPPMDVETPGG